MSNRLSDVMSGILRPGRALILGLALSGCAAEQEPAYYLLAARADSGATTAPQSTASGVIGLRELAMPLYVRRTQIASVGPDGAVSLSDDHRWAEETPRSASRVVARSLSALTGRPVVIEPWPVGVDPAYRVDIEVDYFAGRLGGELRLEGQYRIVRADGSAGTTNTFALTETSTGPGYDALVESHKRALGSLEPGSLRARCRDNSRADP